MSSDRRVTAKTSDGNKSYRISEYSGKYSCYKVGTWSDDKLGGAKSLEDALSIIRSHAKKYGSVYDLDVD